MESIQLGAARKILGCSSTPYKVNDERYPRLLSSEWVVRKCRGRQRKTWRKVVRELLLQLNLDSQEIFTGDYNVNLFLERVDEVLRYR